MDAEPENSGKVEDEEENVMDIAGEGSDREMVEEDQKQAESNHKRKSGIVEVLNGLLVDHQQEVLRENGHVGDGHHSQEAGKAAGRKKSNSKLDSDDDEAPQFVCKRCGMQFHEYSALGGHMASHTKRAKHDLKATADAGNGGFECGEVPTERARSVDRTIQCPLDDSDSASSTAATTTSTGHIQASSPDDHGINVHAPPRPVYVFGVNLAA